MEIEAAALEVFIGTLAGDGAGGDSPFGAVVGACDWDRDVIFNELFKRRF
ncbi:hypothetical protein [Actinoplanes awajinensis]|nr:hypothetical protein [Actinoplanes awajinensis]